jgi:hypothetical protein
MEIPRKGSENHQKEKNGKNTNKPWGTTPSNLYIPWKVHTRSSFRPIILPSHMISPWSSQASPIEILRKIEKPNELGFQEMAAILSPLGLYGGKPKD